MPPALTRYATTSDGVNIAYVRVGDGDPVVFSSNFGGDVHNHRAAGSEQKGLTDRLAALGWAVVRHDTRGMGASDRDVSDWRLEARVRDLEAVVAALGISRFALAGIDQGAPAAIAYAAKYPAAVSHLVLICPWAHGESRYALPALRVAMSSAANAGSAWEILTNVIGNVVTQFADPERAQRIAASIRESMSAEGLNAYFAASRTMDVRDMLPRIAAPTLVIHEPSFPFGSYELCQEVASGIPNAHLIVVQDGSVTGKSYDETVPAIHGFLLRGGDADAHRAPPPAGETEAALTPREREVLRLIAAGCANKAIASALAMSERTVARHITNLYAKIGTRSKAAATAYAIRHGLT
jgi:pimeloyl-ACP methyl ester carboxylesterase/DNA-binding CsgD family transcriptional regulator